MLKITGGKFKGRNIQSLKGLETRPTASRTRQSIFDVLTNSNKGFPPLSSARVLDLYAGTGIMGFEALSRGAGEVVFVDSSRKAGQAIKQNVEKLKTAKYSRILTCKVSAALQNLEKKGESFDLVFMDPPYAACDERRFAFERLANGCILSQGGCLVIEGPALKSGEKFQEKTVNERMNEVCSRKWGDTEVRFFSYV